MRLFIAAELPGEITDALAETSALLRAHVRGRYVAPDSFHVTLAFLGDVEGARVERAISAIDKGCRDATAFAVELGDLGSFGRRSKATLWQGFRDPGALPAIAESVRDELSACGFAFDEKPFRAHITLMRAADLTSGALPSPSIAKGEIDSITLFKSDLSGARPVYEPLHICQLGRLR